MKKLLIGLIAVIALLGVSQVSRANGPVFEIEGTMIQDAIGDRAILHEALIPQVFLTPEADSDWEWEISHVQDISYKDYVDILVSGRVSEDLDLDNIATLISIIGPFVDSSDVSSKFYTNVLCDGVPPTVFDGDGEVVCDGETSYAFVAVVKVKRSIYSHALRLKFEYNRDESPELSVCEYFNKLNGTDYVCSPFVIVRPEYEAYPYIPSTEDDSDGDGIVDADDNCPDDANADQADSDGDGIGDVCDDVDDSADSGVVVDDDTANSGDEEVSDVAYDSTSLGSSMAMQGNGFSSCTLMPGSAGNSCAAFALALMFAPVLVARFRRK
jgi:hypothetical protein